MKKYVLVAIFGFMAAPAFAGHWFCTATGLDSNMREQSVSGDYEPTEPRARQSAVDRCFFMGYYNCRVDSCFNLAPNEDERDE